MCHSGGNGANSDDGEVLPSLEPTSMETSHDVTENENYVDFNKDVNGWLYEEDARILQKVEQWASVFCWDAEGYYDQVKDATLAHEVASMVHSAKEHFSSLPKCANTMIYYLSCDVRFYRNNHSSLLNMVLADPGTYLHHCPSVFQECLICEDMETLDALQQNHFTESDIWPAIEDIWQRAVSYGLSTPNTVSWYQESISALDATLCESIEMDQCFDLSHSVRRMTTMATCAGLGKPMSQQKLENNIERKEEDILWALSEEQVDDSAWDISERARKLCGDLCALWESAKTFSTMKLESQIYLEKVLELEDVCICGRLEMVGEDGSQSGIAETSKRMHILWKKAALFGLPSPKSFNILSELLTDWATTRPKSVVSLATDWQMWDFLRTVLHAPGNYQPELDAFYAGMHKVLRGGDVVSEIALHPLGAKILHHLVRSAYGPPKWTEVMESDLICLSSRMGELFAAKAATLYLILEILQKRPDLHGTVAKWFVKNPAYPLMCTTTHIVAAILTRSWYLPSVRDLASLYTQYMEDGVYVYDESENYCYLSPGDHNFIESRLLRDYRYEKLRPILYQFHWKIADSFDNAAKNFPELEEAVKKAKGSTVTWAY